MQLDFFWYPKCSTCRKAKKWLDENGIVYEAISIVEQPPSKDTLRKVKENSGVELKKLFNTSGQSYRNLGLKDKLSTMSEDEQYDLLASDGMLIKRPILIGEDKATIGFKETEYEETWKE